MIFQWILSRPKWSVALAAAGSLILSLGLLRIEIDASTQSLFSSDAPDIAYHQEVKANFGSDSFVIVVLRNREIFTSESLRLLRRLVKDLEAVEGVEQVISLFSVQSIKSAGNSLWNEPALLRIPGSEDELSAIREDFLSKPTLPGFLINESATATAIQVVIEDAGDDTNREQEVTGHVQRIVEQLSLELDDSGSELYFLGAPLIKKEATRYILHDLTVLGPIALAVIGLIIWLFYRSATATFLPLLTGTLSVLSTLGFMGYVGLAVNPFTSVVVVLILVMGCTEDLHILAEYGIGRRAGLARRMAVAALRKSVLPALILTSATTFLGFASIIPNPVAGLRDFAITCSVGILLNFLLTIFLVPPLLILRPSEGKREFSHEPNLDPVSGFLVKTNRHRKIPVAALTLLLITVSLAGITRLKVDTDYLLFFPEDSLVRQMTGKFKRDFGGASFFSITIETNRKNGVYETEVLRDAMKLNAFLKEHFEHSLGIVDILEEISEQLDESVTINDPAERLNFAAGQFAENFGGYVNSVFVDHDASRLLIRVRSFLAGSEGMNKAEDAILEFASDNLSPALEVQVTGERVLITKISDRITRQLVVNLLILSLVVVVLLSLFFRSPVLGLLSMLPNALPVVTTFGFMGWTGIQLGTGSFSVAIVAFGIAVDDTIHFMSRFRQHRMRGRSPDDAIQEAFRSEIRPILATSSALILGYLVLVFSPFLAHRETGILFAIAIFTALVADLLVTPLLLRFLPVRRNDSAVG